MAYTTAEAQRQLLYAIALATGELSSSLACLGEAPEQLDEQTAQRLEEGLFRPVQQAYATARRTSVEFAGRAGLQTGALETQMRGAPSHGAKGFITEAVDAVRRADTALAELQDSMLPVEVGDAPLRAGLRSVRERLAEVTPAAQQLLRTLGR